MMLLSTGCAVQNKGGAHWEYCRKYVVTYGDGLECMIKLDELQK